MKLFALLFLALIATSFCKFTLPKTKLAQDLKDHRKIDDLRYFFRTLFDQFNLTEPEGIISCFDEKSAGTFFKSFYLVHQLLNDTQHRNQWSLHIDYAKLLILFKTHQKIIKCVQNTTDYQDLLDALEIEEKNPEYLAIVKYIYYQARYASLLNDFNPVIKRLNQKDNKHASIYYAKALSNMADTLNYRGLNFLAKQAFENGFNIHLDLKNPSDSLRCWNNETSRYYLEFFWKLSESITNGTWREAPINVHYFWRDIGKDLMEKIPDSVWDCLEKSRDGQEIIHTIGLNIYDGSFVQPMLFWVRTHRLKFYGLMKEMRTSFEHYNLNHVGGVYARFLQEVAKRQPNDDDTEPEVDIEDIIV